MKSDFRSAVFAALDDPEKRLWSNHKIGAEVGCSHVTVGTHRSEWEAEHPESAVPATLGLDGQTRRSVRKQNVRHIDGSVWRRISDPRQRERLVIGATLTEDLKGRWDEAVTSDGRTGAEIIRDLVQKFIAERTPPASQAA
jgi:hypothetical protein